MKKELERKERELDNKNQEKVNKKKIQCNYLCIYTCKDIHERIVSHSSTLIKSCVMWVQHGLNHMADRDQSYLL